METIYKSKMMATLLARTELGANTTAPAFITGESGTGKEHIARLLHDKGRHSTFPFVAINCAALPAQLIEAELFGAKKGSYTGSVEDRMGLFREAEQGTIFLDEITEMPIEVQSKLLRVLQDNQVRAIGDSKNYPIHCRLVAASNKDIAKVMEESKFRHDLYHRLAVVTLHAPALRDRAEDIKPLVEYFLDKFNKLEKKMVKLSSGVMEFLERQSWEGNVRQLQNFIHRAVIFSISDILTEKDFQDMVMNKTATESTVSTFNLEDLERKVIQQALVKYEGNRADTSRALGIDPATLYRKIKNMGIATE